MSKGLIGNFPVAKYYTFLIPCETKFFYDFSGACMSYEKYVKNPDFVFRFSDKGVAAINGVFGGYSIDKSLESILRKDIIEKDDLEENILKFLVGKKILIPFNENIEEPKVITLRKSVTAYYGLIEITSRCNAKCRHCYLRNEISRKWTEDLSFSEVRKRLDKLVKLGILQVEITGGEPLLHSEIEKIVGYAKKRNLKVILPTNASVWQLRINAILSSDEIVISLDGDEKYHDSYRGIPGLFNKAYSLLQFLSEKYDGNVFISSVVHDENYLYVPKLIEVAKKVNATIILQRVIGRPGFKLSEKSVRKIEEYIKKSGYDKVRFKTIRPPKEKNGIYRMVGCNWGRKDFFVSFDGRILPCLYARFSSIGDIDSSSTDDIEYEREEQRKEYINSFDKCSKCPFKDFCGGPCRFSKTCKRWGGKGCL